MDSSNWLAVGVIATWVLGGLFVAVRMGRAGHDLRIVVPLGLLLGPFLAWFASVPGHAEGPTLPSHTRPVVAPGDLDVLVGLDGSEESLLAARAAVDMLRGSLSSLTLATVLDLEDRGPRSGVSSQSAAYAGLVDAAVQLGFEPIELELLYGPPARALAEWAAQAGIEMIVVGARGEGLSERLLGSVATELIGESPVPVLVGPQLASRSTEIGTARFTVGAVS